MLRAIFSSLAVVLFLNCALAQQNDSGNLYPIFENGKLGYIDKGGQVVIKPQFERVEENTTEYDLIQFSEGLAGAVSKGKWGFINPVGRWVVEPQFDHIESFSEGLAAIEINGKWGFIDKTGKIVIEPQYSWVNGFSDGLAAVDIVLSDDDDGYTIRCGYIDQTGRVVIKPKFDMAFKFSEGLAPVSIGSQMGYINKSGEFVIKPLSGIASEFSEGAAQVHVNNLVGFIDKKGRWIAKPQFNLASDFSNGMALIQTKMENGDWLSGYIDKTGQPVINPRFEDSGSFSDEVAWVKVGNKEGYMDKTGQIVIAPEFDSAGTLHRGLARVRKGETVGYINKKGEFVWQTLKWNVKAEEENAAPNPVKSRIRLVDYFPPLVFDETEDSNDYTVEWYSKHLEAMQEPSLWLASRSAEAHAYRFLWLRSFHHPVVIRLTIEKNGTGILSAKVTTGKGGYEPGDLRTDKTLALSRAQVNQFLKQLGKAKFWSLPTEKEATVKVDADGNETVEVGLDGAQWIIEGAENGKYHIVDRWSTKKGAYRDAALLLIRFAELKFKEIY